MSSQIQSTNITTHNTGSIKKPLKVKNRSSFANIADSFQHSTNVSTDNKTIDINKASRLLTGAKKKWNMEEMWSLKADGAIFTSPVMGPDNTMSFGINSGKIYSVDRTTGKVKWTGKISGDIRWTTYDKDGVLYAGGNMGNVHAFDKNGNQLWETKIGEYAYNPPSIADNGTMFITDYSDNLISLNSKNGEVNWKKEYMLHQLNDAPGFLPDGTPYMFAGDAVVKFEINTGKDLGDFNWHDYHGRPAINDKGEMFFGEGQSTKDQHLASIDLKTGKKLWQTDIDGFVMGSPVLGKDGTLYASISSGKIMAVDSNTGKEKWTYKSGLSKDPFLLLDNRGTIITGEKRHKEFFAINGETGKFKGNYKLPELIINTPSLGENGEIYVTDIQNKLYAFKQKDMNDLIKEEMQNRESQDGERPEITEKEEFVIIGGVKVRKNR